MNTAQPTHPATLKARQLATALKERLGGPVAIDQSSYPIIKLPNQEHIVNLAGLVDTWVICSDSSVKFVNFHGDILHTFTEVVDVRDMVMYFEDPNHSYYNGRDCAPTGLDLL